MREPKDLYSERALISHVSVMDNTVPHLTAYLSLSSCTHSFSSDEAPLLNVHITSHYSSPITIDAGELSPALLIRHGALKIIELANGMEVQQSVRTRCIFEPPTKVEVKLNKNRLLELQPGNSVTLSAPFSRPRKPLPKEAEELETEDGARVVRVCGVDGLEPGHQYCIQLADRSHVHWTIVRWWEYGTKEEVLRPDENGVRLNARKVMYHPGPHEQIKLDVSRFLPLVFACVE